MIKLSERLQKIADFIKLGESMADIGTDHGLLPIYLWENNISPKLILSDINQGPLEKANFNINAYNLKTEEQIDLNINNFVMRKGSGLETLNPGEVDDVVIAGMGGNVIIEILNLDIKKAKSYKKFILQPRTAPEKLKEWLLHNGFSIIDEVLVTEGKYIWEIIVAKPLQGDEMFTYEYKREYFKLDDIEEIEIFKNCWDKIKKLKYEISPILIEKNDPLLDAFIKRRLIINKKIIKDIRGSTIVPIKLKELEEKVELETFLLSCICK